MSEARKLNALIPELYCTSINASVAFYTELLGFKILYQREEATFAMLERQGAQIMLDEYVPGSPRSWIAGPLEAPFGRGVNMDIHTDNADELYEKVKASGAKIFLPIEDKWYRADDIDLGSRQFIGWIQTAIFCASPAASERARRKQCCNLSINVLDQAPSESRSAAGRGASRPGHCRRLGAHMSCPLGTTIAACARATTTMSAGADDGGRSCRTSL